jgi:hypothetical protein
VAINYSILEGLPLGEYTYTIAFEDLRSNVNTDSVTFTVIDTINPEIISFPSDFSVSEGYTGQTISWTASDLYPGTYSIELDGTEVVSSTSWVSGVAITYDIPEGLPLGDHIYTITFEDVRSNIITDSVTFTVIDVIIPVIISVPNGLIVETGYSGQTFSWTASDLSPNTYIIELQGMGIVVEPTSWTSGVAIVFSIPEGFSLGNYIYTITFMDDGNNIVTDSVNFSVVTATDDPTTTTDDTTDDTDSDNGSIGIISMISVIVIAVAIRRKKPRNK